MSDENFKTFLILNPKSGGGGTGSRVGQIAEQVRAAVGSFEKALTRGPGHATELCREALDRGFEMVVAVGGDGSFNEVANGFFEGDQPVSPEAVMGFIPAGTGGDLRRTLGIPTDVKGACARLSGRETKRIDVGYVELVGHDGQPVSRRFVNISSFGASGAVVDTVNKSSKALGGKLSFMLGSARALMKYEDKKVTLTYDDAPPETRKITTVSVCNGKYFGGGMMVGPDADPSDGLFHVTEWAGYSLKDFALKSRMIYDGSHTKDPRTTVRPCKQLKAESEETVLIDLDGEQPGRLPATYRILPSALKIKV